MTCLQQSAQSAHQFGDVIEVQARGGLVKQKQSTFACRGLSAGRSRFRRISQETRQLQTLCFTAAEGGHGLSQAHIFQAHIHNRLQSPNHFAVIGKQLRGFTHCQGQYVSHIQKIIGI